MRQEKELMTTEFIERPLRTQDFVELENQYGAHNYHPLDVVIERAEGVWVYDVEGKRYLDCLAAYSAVNQGHCHPEILKALVEQAHKVTLTSRAFRNDQLPLFYKEVHELTGYDMALPMNSGSEAVETAIKTARKWGYKIKGIPEEKAEVIVCSNNFHGRTITEVSFSTDAQYRDGFGPFTPGFKVIPFGDVQALEDAISPHTCAFLVEPIQGEAGIIIPPAGFLKQAAVICRQNRVLLIVDEIQSGHGSTFGGSPLGCAVARAALRVLMQEKLVERSAELGAYFLELLQKLRSPDLKEVRGKGLWIGIELHSPARAYCEALKEEGILCKETHDRVIRIAPPLIIQREEIDWAFERIRKVI